jgi:hypothetical protein
LSRGTVDVDKYYREAEDAVHKTPPSQLADVLNEVFEQHIRALTVVEPNALRLSLVAGALFRAACESEEPDRSVVVLLCYSYALLAGGKPLDAALFLPASAASARLRHCSRRSTST